MVTTNIGATAPAFDIQRVSDPNNNCLLTTVKLFMDKELSEEEKQEKIEKLLAAIAEGGSVKMTDNLSQDDMLKLMNEIELDMAGKTISNKEKTTSYQENASGARHGVVPYASGSISNGKIEATFIGLVNAAPEMVLENMSISGDVYAVSNARGNMIIKSGKYVGGMSTAVQCEGGKIIIEGGEFSATQDASDIAKGKDFTVNCMDSLFKNNPDAVPTDFIEIRGGKFYKFDPSNAMTEPSPWQPCSFVAEGFKVVQNGDWFEVVPE